MFGSRLLHAGRFGRDPVVVEVTRRRCYLEARRSFQKESDWCGLWSLTRPQRASGLGLTEFRLPYRSVRIIVAFSVNCCEAQLDLDTITGRHLFTPTTSGSQGGPVGSEVTRSPDVDLTMTFGQDKASCCWSVECRGRIFVSIGQSGNLPGATVPGLDWRTQGRPGATVPGSAWRCWCSGRAPGVDRSTGWFCVPLWVRSPGYSVFCFAT